MSTVSISLLRAAAQEIRVLRHINEVLEAKVSVIELFRDVLHAQVRRSDKGAEVDMVWKLEREADRIEKEER